MTLIAFVFAAALIVPPGSGLIPRKGSRVPPSA